MSSVECVLLTGFLGSGKTTLLNRLLRDASAKGTAVVINEVGDIGIDQLVLAEVADNLFLLESGCLCCTLSGTLRDTLLDLISTSRDKGYLLERIVIETTGLAEPLPILHSLIGDKALTEAIHLSLVVVVVDAVNVLNQIQQHPECVRQIAAAELAVVSKADLVDEDQHQRIYQAVTQINPLAACVDADGDVAALFAHTANAEQKNERERALTDPMRPGGLVLSAQGQLLSFRGLADRSGNAATIAEDTAPDTARHEDGPYLAKAAYHQRIRTESFYLDGPVYWAGVAAWWHMLVQRYGKNLLRCKGLLHLVDPSHPYAFIQGVGDYFHSPQYLAQWPDADLRSRLICIGVGLERSWLEASLLALRIEEPGLRPSTLEELHTVIPEKT